MKKEQRLIVYHKMLNDFRVFNKSRVNAQSGFCYWCNLNDVRLKDLKELMHQKPHSKHRVSREDSTLTGWWWAVTPGQARRIKAIQDAINLTKT